MKYIIRRFILVASICLILLIIGAQWLGLHARCGELVLDINPAQLIVMWVARSDWFYAIGKAGPHHLSALFGEPYFDRSPGLFATALVPWGWIGVAWGIIAPIGWLLTRPKKKYAGFVIQSTTEV